MGGGGGGGRRREEKRVFGHSEMYCPKLESFILNHVVIVSKVV